MMQKIHFQKVTTFLLLVALIASAMPLRAQLSETLVNSEYRDIILKQLQKKVQRQETTIQQKAEQYLLALPNERKLYDESKMSIKVDLVSGITSDGLRELNYKFSIVYSCHHFESVTDNYPTGKYRCEESNASMAIAELSRKMIDEVCPDAFKSGKAVDVKIMASTDITPVTHLDYNNEYGEHQYIAARYNGESVRISLSQKTGINSNAQLAFARALGLRDNIEHNISHLKKTDNTFAYDTRSSSESGPQYRDVGIEFTVHSAYDEEIVEMNERLINDEFVDYNIPKTTEGSNANTYALIIANERYGDPLPDVPYAYNDGEVMQQYCLRTLGIPARQVKILEDATVQTIRTEGIDWMKQIAAARKGDCNFIVYYAGHGIADYDYNPYLVPAGIDNRKIKAFKDKKNIDTGVPLTRGDTKQLLKQCLRVDTLCAWFNRVPLRSVTMIVDASFDGKQRDGMPLIYIKHSDKKAKGLRIRNDIVVMSAAAFDKTAFAFDEQHHGFFTYFLLKELKKCKGDITHSELWERVDSEVQRESSLQGLLQEPAIAVGGKLKDNWGRLRLRP